MLPEAFDFDSRALLTERMDEPCTREQLRACLRDIARANGWLLGYRPLFEWLEANARKADAPIRILDVGCGSGDCLRRVARWTDARGIAVELTGLDINPDAVAIAAEADAAGGIAWVCANVFAYEPSTPPHFIVSSLFTHHLSDTEVVRFLAWMEEHATAGWFVNDLSRGAVPYHLFRIFSRLVRLHPFVQHDGPVSVARSFVVEDWRRFCAAARFREADVSIRQHWPARLCVARSKSALGSAAHRVPPELPGSDVGRDAFSIAAETTPLSMPIEWMK
jgi:SAM-dependent methyltransferase